MAKNTPEDHPVGNVDPGKRGRGTSEREGENTIGQKIPKRAHDEIKPKSEK
jgi:hypothetical protein